MAEHQSSSYSSASLSESSGSPGLLGVAGARKVPIPRLPKPDGDGRAGFGKEPNCGKEMKHRVSHACEPCRQRKTKVSGCWVLATQLRVVAWVRNMVAVAKVSLHHTVQWREVSVGTLATTKHAMSCSREQKADMKYARVLDPFAAIARISGCHAIMEMENETAQRSESPH